MEQLGHDPCVVQVEGQGWEFEAIGRDGGGAALAAGQFTTNTVLCSNDRLAIGFLAACYESRMRVGREADCSIRVAGQDDHPFACFTCPALTTVAQDYEAISREAANTLFKAIDGEPNPHEIKLFEGKLVMRASA